MNDDADDDTKSMFDEQEEGGGGDGDEGEKEDETQLVADHTYNEAAVAVDSLNVGDTMTDTVPPTPASSYTHSLSSKRSYRTLPSRSNRSIHSAVSDTTLTAASYGSYSTAFQKEEIIENLDDDDGDGDGDELVVPSTPSFSLTSSKSRQSFTTQQTGNRRINFEDETDRSRTLKKTKKDHDYDDHANEGVPTTPMSERTDGNSFLGLASFLGDWDKTNNKKTVNKNKKKSNSISAAHNKNNKKKETKKEDKHSSSGDLYPSSSASSSFSSSSSSTKRGLQSFLRDEESGTDENSDNNADSKSNSQSEGKEEEENQTSYPDGLMLVRGTDIHIETAARAFQDFLLNFISLEDCDKKKKIRINYENEEDPSISSDLEDEFSSYTTPPYYIEKLKAILLGVSSTNKQDSGRGNNNDDDDDDEGLRSLSILASTAFIDLNSQHLFQYSLSCQKLYYQLISSPTEVVPLFDILVGQQMELLLKKLHEEKAQALFPSQKYATLQPLSSPIPRTQVRPFYLKQLSYMRSLDPNAIDNLLSIRGMIVRSSPIIPDLKVAYFECDLCAFAESVTLSNGRIQEPTVCRGCNAKESFRLIHNRCIFADKQMVRMQETPDEVPAGETPASIVLFAFDDLVDAVRPGDRVEVTGILRAQPRRVHPRISKVKSVYKTYLDVIHFRRISGTKDRGVSSSSMNARETFGVLPKSHKNEDSDDDSTLIPITSTKKKKSNAQDEGVNTRGKGITIEHIGSTLSKERVELLKQLASDPDIYERLVQSLAPSIWGMDDVKKGVLCMLFGGNSKRVKKGTSQRMAKRSKISLDNSLEDDEDDATADSSVVQDEDTNQTKLYKRGDINILLCGDPGTSKSQLLSYVHVLSPRGVYTSGKGSSAVGLTASIVRDPETRELVLESGALVLSDLGCCCIDEFDKMSDTTRAILHEAMEQQTVSIAKAGIIATLNSRTSILASANPVESRYNPQLSVVENIKLPPTLLSRFDLIYLILDAPNIENDRRLAQHLVGLYYESPDVVQPPLDQNLLRDFIAYARENILPELSDLATRDLISAYLEMRSLGGSSGTITATTRQLESLIRLSEALAKMRYSTIVSRADVKEAVRLMRVATQAAATDPRTGRIDMDMITTGRTAVNREMEEALNSSLKDIIATKRGNRLAVGDVRRELMEVMNLSSINQDEIIDALRRVEADGLIQFNERSQTIFVRAGMI